MVEQRKDMKQPSLALTMAKKYNLSGENFLKTLKATIIKPSANRDATNEELMSFMIVANKYNLNPFTNEIYAFPAKKGGIVPVVGVDGYVTIMNRDKNADGMKIEYSDNIVETAGAKACPEWCEITIYRKDRENPVVIREYLDEVYVAPRGNFSGPWQSHTKRMLRHKAIIQAIRTSFGITGIYDEDEAKQIADAEVIDVSTKPITAEPQKKIEGSGVAQSGPEGAPGTATEKKMSSAAQQKAIHAIAGKIAKKKGVKEDEILQEILKPYQKDRTSDLTMNEASKVITDLGKRVEEMA